MHMTIASGVRPARALFVTLLAVALCRVARRRRQAPRFYDDDPIAREPEPQDASGAQPWTIGLLFDLSYNLFVTSKYKPSGHARAEHQHDRRGAGLQLVHQPHRHREPSRRRDRARPATSAPPPAPEQLDRSSARRSSGAHPGFTAQDANGETWFLAFDRPDHPEGATAPPSIADKSSGHSATTRSRRS